MVSIENMQVSWSFASIVILAMFSGCIGGDEALDPDGDNIADEAEDAQVSATTGAIRGTLSSDLFEPLGGATVAVAETGDETKVARNGEFVFHKLEPGRYTLHFSALGYEQAARAVDVKAGDVANIDMQLVPLPSNDPYSQEFVYAGLLPFSARWQAEGPDGCVIIPTGVLLDVKSCGGLGGGTNTHITTNLSEDAETMIIELVWNPAGPLGEYLSLDVICDEAPRGQGGAILDDQHPCYMEAPRGKSPLTIRTDRTDEVEGEYTWTGDWESRVFADFGMLGTYDLTGVDAGVAYQQSFTYYITVWHKEPAPEGYSAIPDQ